ncbi:MAG: NAD(P)/FAD-dependent oxidoreductase [Bacteroidales bacterium]|nr:NAD(P)/FAD-dependent oxidoreductase [Bacteroidales bacterium]
MSITQTSAHDHQPSSGCGEARPSGLAIIAGAGPAGLTAAYELLHTTQVRADIYEQSDRVGGLSCTVEHHGNRMDIGGHRFFSKSPAVNAWWERMMPLQGAPAKDDVLLQDNSKPLQPGGPDPEKTDQVMLIRRRISRILFLRRFFDYPLSLQTMLRLGPFRLFRAGCGYIAASLFPRPENTLEDFYINRFGRPLYAMFFENYTEKVWGIHPSRLEADWGGQRIKGLSVRSVLKDLLRRTFGRKSPETPVETSLIGQFKYPKYGPGQLWETVAGEVRKAGGQILLQNKVTGIHIRDHRVISVTVTTPDGISEEKPCDYLLSTMPVKDLIAAMDGIEIPPDVRHIAVALPYRDFIVVGLCVDRLKIKNRTGIRTFDGRIPDTWIYVQEHDVKMGRIQVFNNWSPYLVADYEHTVWMEAEYFCSEGDNLWQMPDEAFIRMAVSELEKTGFIAPGAVRDAVRVKVRKAYPSYSGVYRQMDTVRTFLDSIENLFCIGRNGQHRYNNMDHSMLTAMECVRNILEGRTRERDNIWNVNTEEVYHEN